MLNLVRDTNTIFRATSVYTTAVNNFQTCRWTFNRLDRARFRRVVFAVLFVSGLVLLLRG